MKRDHHDPVYNAWRAMRRRCFSPTYYLFKYYGQRGITVCDRWATFETFRDDMGPRPPGTWLEREDNDKGYNPDNCIWATPAVQSRNQRGNVNITIDGVTMCMTDWCRKFGTKPTTVRTRISNGISPAVAVQMAAHRGTSHAKFTGVCEGL